MHKVIDIRL